MKLPLPQRIELSVLLAGLAIAACLWGFVELAEAARGAEPHALDTEILLAFREAGRPDDPIGPRWLEEAVRDVTSLGSTVVLVLVTLGAAVYLLLIRRWLEASLLLAAMGVGQILSSLLKSGIDRPRPELVSHLVEVETMSFPSGHAMLAAIAYLTLGAMLARIAPSPASKIYLLLLGVLVTLAVGVSRIYLGVHWPSDVLAGWCAGFAWATLCWLTARFLLGRDAGKGNQQPPG